MAEYVPLFNAGNAITRTASAPITGGQLVVVTGPGTVAPSTGGTHSWLGVASTDAATGDPVTIYRMGVGRLVASAPITAGQTVEPSAGGTVAPHTNGTNDVWVFGLALTTAPTGGLVEVKLRR